MISGKTLTTTVYAAMFLAFFAFEAFAQNQPAQQTQPAQQAQPQKAQSTTPSAGDQPSDIGAGWRVNDFEPFVKSLKDLEKLGKEYSQTVLKLAIDEYSTGIDILHDMESELLKSKAAYDKKNNLNERWYWQEIDRKNEQERHLNFVKIEAKMKAITHFTRAINSLDSVQAIEVRKEPTFVNFQVKLYQSYISTNYDLHNLKPCIPILEKYVTINDKTKGDVWAYKYLASCYGFMEAHLVKYGQVSDDLINDYKQKKNRALLQAVELSYGIESPQYQQLKEVVELDEKKTEKINDFK
jgi:hypothetical protein